MDERPRDEADDARAREWSRDVRRRHARGEVKDDSEWLTQRLEEVRRNLAMSGLVKLVKAKYPERCSLREIAETWGSGEELTPEEIAAIAQLEES